MKSAGILIAALSLSTLMAACASSSKQSDVKPLTQRVYSATPEEVERALRQVLVKYPPRIDNPEAGHFETEYIKGDLRFRPPYITKPFSSGYRYRLVIRVIKGRIEDKPSVKVIVSKVVELARDFFSDPEEQTSDGQEEQVILYRIQREIQIDRALQRAAAEKRS